MSKWRETNSEREEELDPYEDSDEDDEVGFVLRVETIMGNVFHVFAYPSDTVELLKTRIAFQEGIPQTDQNLLLGKKTLDNPNTLLAELGLTDDSTLRIITNIASGLPFKREPSPSPPFTFRQQSTINRSTTTRSSDESDHLKLPRLRENQIDGVLVLRDKNDRRVFLIVKRAVVDPDEEDDEDTGFDVGGDGDNGMTLGCRKQSRHQGSNSKITKSGRDPHLERIRENAKTLKKMSEIRQTLYQKKRNDTENLELPKITADSKSLPNRTINSSIASLNRLKAEIYLQSRKEDYFPGSPPYTQEQLWKYVQLKVSILLSDNNGQPSSRFLRSSRIHGLTPTVIVNRKLWQKAGNNKKTGRESRSKSKENMILMSSSNHSLEFERLPSATYISGGTGRRPISGRLILSRPAALISNPPDDQGTAASIKKNKVSVRCHECKKKIGIVCRYHCRCGLIFCTKHRYAEAHKCTFDYKEEGRRLIREANPLITPSKVPEI